MCSQFLTPSGLMFKEKIKPVHTTLESCYCDMLNIKYTPKLSVSLLTVSTRYSVNYHT